MEREFSFHLQLADVASVTNGTRIHVPFVTISTKRWISQDGQEGRRDKLSWTAPLQGCKFARGEGRDKEEKREKREKRENRTKKHNKRDSPTFLRLWLP
jgi:hypothetical protein